MSARPQKGDRTEPSAEAMIAISARMIGDWKPRGRPQLPRRLRLRSAAGDRFDQLELNLSVLSVIFTDGDPDLTITRQVLPGQSDEQLRANPGVLIGSVGQVAETLLGYREKYRLTYFSVIEPHMKDFAKVIERLR